METETEIYFFGIKNEFGYMSNFYKCEFIDSNGIKYNCNEQYFMYRKCELFDPSNEILKQQILFETSPTKIKKYGRQVKNYSDSVWDSKRYNIMLDGLRLKFSQNDVLRQKLLATGNKTLYEASPFDKIWGIGFQAIYAMNKDKSLFGKNLLGKALMKVRSELQNY